MFAAALRNNLVTAAKDFFADNVSIKSHLLDGMLGFPSMLRHWRYFGLNFGYFNSFHNWVRGGSWLRRIV